MSVVENSDLQQYCLDVSNRAKHASAELTSATGGQKNQWLRQSAQALRDRTESLRESNELDIAAAPEFALTDAQVDRLRLTPERVEGIAQALEEIAMLPDPIGEVIESSVRPNGLEVSKVRVPLGVVFFIYESRPNVTADAAAICLKSGNAVILRGGKEAANSSRAIVDILRDTAIENGLPADAIQLVSTTDREAVGHFLSLAEYIDVASPRGGEGLIRRVSEEACMPVIKHFAGNCHVYVDSRADLKMAEQITVNSKCQRLGVCNTCESLLVHADVAAEFIPAVGRALSDQGIEIRGDQRTVELVTGAKEATEDDFYAEYLGPIISVQIVESLDEAIQHINQYGSHHTDAIITRDVRSARRFVNGVDSSAVMVNASTRFNDGGEFGLGAEIGISTDKFHARGPCGLRELTSYKYVCYGDGHTRG
jgi:glutamate-5-semialdehyde dehydrogenase